MCPPFAPVQNRFRLGLPAADSSDDCPYLLSLLSTMLGDAPSQALSETLKRLDVSSKTHPYPQQAFSQLSQEDQALLKSNIGDSELKYILNLSNETNQTLFGTAAYHFAITLKNSHKDSQAYRVFALVSQMEGVPGHIKTAAHRECEIIAGTGDHFTERLEYLASRSFKEIFDPRTFLPMMGAWTLGKVLGMGAIQFLRARGIGVITASAFGGTSSYLAEVPAYVGLRKLAGIDEDLRKAGRMIGLMKLSGGLAEGVIGLSQAGKTAALLTHGMGMYVGLGIERTLEGGDPKTGIFHLENLWSMLSLSLGMGMGKALLGKWYQNWVEELGVREAYYLEGRRFWNHAGYRMRELFNSYHGGLEPVFAGGISSAGMGNRPTLLDLTSLSMGGSAGETVREVLKQFGSLVKDSNKPIGEAQDLLKKILSLPVDSDADRKAKLFDPIHLILAEHWLPTRSKFGEVHTRRAELVSTLIAHGSEEEGHRLLQTYEGILTNAKNNGVAIQPIVNTLRPSAEAFRSPHFRIAHGYILDVLNGWDGDIIFAKYLKDGPGRVREIDLFKAAAIIYTRLGVKGLPTVFLTDFIPKYPLISSRWNPTWAKSLFELRKNYPANLALDLNPAKASDEPQAHQARVIGFLQKAIDSVVPKTLPETPTTISIAQLIPTRLLTVGIEEFNQVRRALYGGLLKQGWTPGNIPSEFSLEAALSAIHPSGINPIVRSNRSQGAKASLLLGGELEVATLISLVSSGVIPEKFLTEPIPVFTYNHPINPTEIAQKAFGVNGKLPDLSLFDLMEWHKPSRQALDKIRDDGVLKNLQDLENP